MKRLILTAAAALIITSHILVFPTGTAISFSPEIIQPVFSSRAQNSWTIDMQPIDSRIASITADPGNVLAVRVQVTDSKGEPVQGAGISLAIEGGDGVGSTLQGLFGKWGSFSSFGSSTGSDGTYTATYKPPGYSSSIASDTITLTAAVPGTTLKASLPLTLVRVPVVLIHGYQASPEIFSDLSTYLDGEGYEVSCFSYESNKGVKAAAGQLDEYLDALKQQYLEKGIQVGSFDIIAHSMGGLVARYYSCSSVYLSGGMDIHKLIFLSVPHNGSMMAFLGLKYFNDSSIGDMLPGSSLFSLAFPSMTNMGLNSTIQTGNILDSYDEVISEENASLEAWGIKTEQITVGENIITLANLISGNFADATNHKKVLTDRQVFERLSEMLDTDLPYPLIKK